MDYYIIGVSENKTSKLRGDNEWKQKLVYYMGIIILGIF